MEAGNSKHIYLALAIHSHQPVGNFDWVFDKACHVAYVPMIEALEHHPTVRMALHYTGPLRDWIAENRPELIERIRALVARGQVEMMTGGYYEPVLVALYDADKRGQIEKLTQAVRDDFGYEPTGAWLAERVWEPHLAKPLAEAGVQYTIVDDTHFKYVGLEDEHLFGYYVTEEQGTTLKIFGTSKHLRYTIPWASVEEVIAWLRGQADESGRKVAVMGDDGEKFGLWPGTYDYCWLSQRGRQGWIEEFFQALERNSDWLTTITPGEYAEKFPALGRIYLPTASYDEMTEWALPAKLSGEIIHLKHRLEDEGRKDVLRFIKGGFWRYFMVKYPEINTMHKKMLLVSEKVHQMTNDQIPNPNELHRSDVGHWSLGFGHSVLDHLWAGQCNCPYWHGVFGGIYLFHIRVANYDHLIAAENLADAQRHPDGSWIEWREFDLDRDASPEVLLSSDAMNLYFDPIVGGTLFEWDWRSRRYNLLNTLTRLPEGYHQDLVEAGSKGETVVAGEEGGTETIHTARVRVKEKDLHEKLFYDWYRRASLIDHFLHPDTTLDDFYRCQYGEAGDFVDQPYSYEVEEGDGHLTLKLTRDGHVWCSTIHNPQSAIKSPLRVEKRIEVIANSTELKATYVLTNTGQEAVGVCFGVEFNFAILGGDGPDAHYVLSEQENAALNSKGQWEDVNNLRLISKMLGMEIELGFGRPATLWRFPIETISNSEAGFERVYQGSCLLPHWRINLAPERSWQVGLWLKLREVQRE